MESSIGAEIAHIANTLDLNGQYHHIVSSSQREGLCHFLSSRLLPDYRYLADVNEVEGLRDVEVEVLGGNVISKTYIDIHARQDIWGSFASDNEYCILRPEHVRLKFGGVWFTWWTVSRWSDGRAHETQYQMLSYKPENAAIAEVFLRKLSRIENIINQKTVTIHVCNGPDVQIGTKSCWEDLILEDKILRSTRDDIEGWIESEERYKKLGVPYRRGYLFEGPPGNGKTAVSRTIVSSYGFTAFMFDFSNAMSTDGHLQGAFRDAAECAPAIFLLEDIDRIFEKGYSRSQISLSGIFNCLDGAATYDGVVVIATANKPELLDPALRLRPGRFDVPVRFNNPSAEMRMRYMNHLFARCEIQVDKRAIADVVDRTSGMSMAFMKSIFEAAAALTRGKITGEALLQASEQVISYYERMTTAQERSAGFSANSEKKKKYKDNSEKKKKYKDNDEDSNYNIDVTEKAPLIGVESDNGGIAGFILTPTDDEVY